MMQSIGITASIVGIVLLARLAYRLNMNIFTLILGLLPFGVLGLAIFGGK